MFGFDPVYPTYGLYPGLAYEFRTHSLSGALESLRVSVNLYAGGNEMQIALHEAEPYVDAFGVPTIRPGQIIESFYLEDALSAATQIVTVESVLQPLLQQDTSYFISLVAIGDGSRQLIRWSVGDGYGELIPIIGDDSDTGLVRAFLSSTGWGTYQYPDYPRGAFEVTAVPEPGTGALCVTGLTLLAGRSRRIRLLARRAVACRLRTFARRTRPAATGWLTFRYGNAPQTAASPLRFRILYCRRCGYEPRAHDLAADRQGFGAEVEIEKGRFGQFDVLLDGKLVASKGGFWRRVTIHGVPPQERLLAAIAKHLAVRDGDVCEIEPAHQAGRASRQASRRRSGCH